MSLACFQHFLSALVCAGVPEIQLDEGEHVSLQSALRRHKCPCGHPPGQAAPTVATGVVTRSTRAKPEHVQFWYSLPLPVLNALRNWDRQHTAQAPELLEIEWLEATQKASEQVRAILLFLSDMGLTEKVPMDVQRVLLQKLHVLNLVDLGEDYLKWKFAHIACVGLAQKEFPARPTWVWPEDRAEHLLGGVVYRFVRRTLHYANAQPCVESRTEEQKRAIDAAVSFGWNISQLKKGMPLVSDAKVEASVAKTIRSLSRIQGTPAPPIVDWCHDDVVEDDVDWDAEPGHRAPLNLDIRVLIGQVVRTSKELFHKGWYQPSGTFTPSISGHFFSKRQKTGALGAIVRNRDNIERLCTFGQLPGTFSLKRKALSQFDHLEVDTCTGMARFCACCGWHPSDTNIIINPQIPDDLILETLDLDGRQAHAAIMAVRPVGLKEPFKVRVITGGPEGKYYRTKYIQKATHSHLRRHPCASLIGEIITAERLNSFLKHPRANEFYVSGDYSAATDNLNPLLSEAAASTISAQAGWHSDWSGLYQESLTGHNIYTGGRKPPSKKLSDLQEECVKQRWGQLMGSPTSFPVLCVVNLALSRFALEMRAGHTIPLIESGILINGDDIGFVTDQEGYDMWKRVTSAGGLEPSLGKNFCSREFIVLNSTFFDITGEGEHRTLVYRPYINYGLLNCRNENGTPIQDLRVTLSSSDDPRSPGIGALARDLIRGHTEEVQMKLLKRFVEAWKPTLRTALPHGMSYWMPRHLGGLGLPIVGQFTSKDGKERYSRCQRVLAAYLAQDSERQGELLMGDTLGHSDSFSLWKKVAPGVKKIMSKINFTWTKDIQEARPSGVAASLLAEAYAGLRREDIEVEEEEEGEDRYAYWKNEYYHLFDHARRTTFQPLTDDQIAADLPWRKRYDDFTVTDFSPRVDLRRAYSSSEVDWQRPTVTHVTETVSVVA